MSYLADQPIDAQPAPLRLCTECAHYHYLGYVNRPHGCGLDACGSRIDPVDGKRLYKFCEAARREDGACGPSGKLWEDAEAACQVTNGQ